ncbi:MAG: hypothetical protein JWM57_2582 [Phycisphaerales bacterium]|nr:hypothetical protein [Phycisphaerales bacterium]
MRPPPLPQAVLDYGSGTTLRARVPSDRGLMVTSAILSTLIAIAILAALAELLIVNWPSFGLILIAVPIALVALAFFSIAITAARFAVRN